MRFARTADGRHDERQTFLPGLKTISFEDLHPLDLTQVLSSITAPNCERVTLSHPPFAPQASQHEDDQLVLDAKRFSTQLIAAKKTTSDLFQVVEIELHLGFVRIDIRREPPDTSKNSVGGILKAQTCFVTLLIRSVLKTILRDTTSELDIIYGRRAFGPLTGLPSLCTLIPGTIRLTTQGKLESLDHLFSTLSEPTDESQWLLQELQDIAFTGDTTPDLTQLLHMLNARVEAAATWKSSETELAVARITKLTLGPSMTVDDVMWAMIKRPSVQRPSGRVKMQPDNASHATPQGLDYFCERQPRPATPPRCNIQDDPYVVCHSVAHYHLLPSTGYIQ